MALNEKNFHFYLLYVNNNIIFYLIKNKTKNFYNKNN